MEITLDEIRKTLKAMADNNTTTDKTDIFTNTFSNRVNERTTDYYKILVKELKR